MTTKSSDVEGLFGRWARWNALHPRRTLATWAVILLALGVIWRSEHGDFVNSLDLPGSESQQAVDLLRTRMPEWAGDSATIVIKSDVGFAQTEVRSEVEALAIAAGEIPGVVGVIDPYAAGVNAISADGSIAFIQVIFEQQADAVPGASIDALYDLRAKHDRGGLQVELGGRVITAGEQTPPSTSEALGVAAAVVILLFAFGSVIAMGLPLATALTGLLASLFLIGLLALRLDLSTETRAFTAMIGIGVGIDYALFIVTRYREALHRGESVVDAIVEANNTAGRSILFAGAIVVVALLGLSTMGIPFVGSLGIAAAIVVALAVLVALTILPALLAIVGRNIDRWSVSAGSMLPTADHRGIWYRLADATQRHPWPIVIGGLAILVVLASPALDMRIGSSDAGNNPTSLSSRRAYDLLAEGFGPGFNGPLTIVVDTELATDAGVGDRLAGILRTTAGVARVARPVLNQEGNLALMTVIPVTSPQSEATRHLVYTIREDVMPVALAGSGAVAYVEGPTAAFIDMGDRISDRLPLFFAVVIGVSVLLLLVVFRSLLVPLQAAIMNLLSIGAAYGVLVAIFQWGWFGGVFGVERTGPIESFLPMMLFAVLFGLSTDYEVFLMSRIHEIWLRTGDNREAVNRGSATTTRVITAAAAIMVVVFLSFTLSDARIVKEFGLGMATAVFIDATIIRMLLVPAVTGLLGRANWYLPNWIDRVLPNLAFEAPPEIAETRPPARGLVVQVEESLSTQS